ncbi:hypothetical protein P9597_05375 [Aneurinibacillus migulanus]|uniref:hypothetical protein n=1 Tax=Aneurinibacillus migulanus TaxID=47500 RepID=UPI002E222BBE|nr:hypothetical protein [Aneurinibacillus migulanus]
MEEKIKDLQERLDKTNISDWYLDEYKGESLRMIGSFDLSYYHEVEVNFNGVSFISCPIYLSYPKFRLASVKEKEMLKNKGIDFTYAVCLDEEDYNATYFVCASELNFTFALTKYYR